MTANWKQVEPGVYVNKSGAKVYKVRERFYTGRAYRHHDVASYRTDTFWCVVMSDGRADQGFGTMREARAFIERHDIAAV